MHSLRKLKFISVLLLAAFISSMISPYHVSADDFSGWTINGTLLASGGNSGNTKKAEPPSSPPKNPCFHGKPVNVHSGEEFYACVDLFIPGRGMNLEIQHLYQSGFHSNTNFGFGWSINYYERVQALSDGNVMITRGAGRQDIFISSGNGVYLAPAGIFEALQQNADGTWTLTMSQGEKHNFNINGTLSTIVDRNNNTITFAYDAAGLVPTTGIPQFGQSTITPIVANYDYRLTQITDTLGRAVNLTYNTNGQLQTITDFASRTVTFAYDTMGRLSTITKPATTQFPSGVVKTFTYDAGGNLLTIKDGKNQVFVTNSYDAQDRVYQQVLGTGTMTFNYTLSGVALVGNYYVATSTGKTTFTDRAGNVTTYTFNTNGNATAMEQFTHGIRAGDPASFITNYAYNSDMLKISETFPKGNGVKYTYDSNNINRRARGNLLQIRRKADMTLPDNDTNDIVVNRTYEPNFNFLKTMTDANGNVTTLTYDYELATNDPRYGTKGNPVTVTFPTAGAQTPAVNFTYNSFGQLTQLTDAKGHITQYAYNPTSGLLSSVSRDPAGINAVTQFTYDTFGNIDTVTDPLNNVTNYDIDALGWLTQVTDAMGFKTKYTYDANGNVTKLERQANAGATLWQTTQYTYDISNKLKTITDPLNRVTTYNYNNNEELTSVVDANNKTTTYQNDERGLLFTVTDANTPTAGVTKYDYDLNGNVSKLTDAVTNATNYAYDNFDRLTTETFPDTRTNVYTYDKNSNVLTRTNPATQQIQYTYDALNRLTNQNYPSSTPMNITYAYDVGSLLTSAFNSFSTNAYTYDNFDRVLTNIQTLNGSNYTVTYTYNKLNQTGVIYPSAKSVTYAYNANNLLTTLSVGGVALMNVTYDTLSRRAQKDLTGTATKQAIYTYNMADELTTLQNKISGGATISKHDYTYDNVSNRLTHVITAAANKNYTYTYNNIYELTGVTGSETSTYAYDKLGNRTTANGTAYTTNNLNQYTAVGGVSRAYDNSGNLTGDGTNTYGYDVENRMTSYSKSGTTASYAYDAFNRRVRKTVNGTATYYVYEGDNIIEERNSSGTKTADYVHGDQTDEPLTMLRGSTTYYYFRDGLGSVRQLTNAAGTVQQTYIYNSYGQLSAAPTVVNPFTFTGREYDTESGNFYYRARYYSPTLGRFLQRDPIGYYDSMNFYKYAANNSINFIDPYGLYWGEDQINWWLREGAVPGPYGQPVSEWRNGKPTGWGDPLKYTECAGGGWQTAERVAVGTAAGATAIAIAAGAKTAFDSQYGLKVRIHPPHHTFPVIGRAWHIQITIWRRGIPGSDINIRIPIYWGKNK
jgi:RHS repeat-associated protein